MADEDEEKDENSKSSPKEYKKPLELFEEKKIVRICAPMVRYSKLPFRELVRRYGCDLCYTPMIISDSFVKSQKARDNEFTTNTGDRPLIVQFAASCAKDFADAAEMVAPFADGVGLNCGCPQSSVPNFMNQAENIEICMGWAMQEGYGAYLIKRPDLIQDMVKQAKSRVSDLPVSVKIRIDKDPSKTVELCRQAEHAGASWISIHARTVKQRNEPPTWDVVKLVKESVSVPVVGNGDIKCETDIMKVYEQTGVNGVMAAQGILNNPAMYAGYDYTPLQCLSDWLDISLSLGTPFSAFHHHLIFMMDKIFSKAEKRVFNSLKSTTAVLDYLEDHYGITYSCSS